MALLSAFNPHEFSEATVRAVATGRDDDLGDILATIRGNLTSKTMQHLIVSAPRGYGKSFMMRHVQIEVERIAREEGLPIAVVLMPEEMPHVKEPETLVRELTRALTGGAGAEAELTWHEDEGSAWEGAVVDLEAAAAAKVGARGLVVALIENFDVLLRRAFLKEVHSARLRELLTARGGRLMLIAASASGAFDRNYDAPLFQAFREVGLTPWSIEESLAFFDRQRKAAGKPPLEDLVRARAKAVALFIGGTPRLATLLGEALLDDDVLGAADLLQKLVDELTPYYKERIEALPGRAQKLLDALLRGGEPATQSEIARRVKASSQAAIAGPFNDLARERIVLGEKAAGSAEVLYRVADRVFAHYYRRRVVDHGAATCPLEAMVDLLATFFSTGEKKARAADFARVGRIREARVMARLHASEWAPSKWTRKLHLRALVHSYGPERLLPLASAHIAGHLRGVLDLVELDRIDDAYELIERNVLSSEPCDRVLLLLARSCIDAAEGIESGLAAAEEASSIAEAVGDFRFKTLADLARTSGLNSEGRFNEALDLVSPLTRDANDPVGTAKALRFSAVSLGRLGRHEDAAEASGAAANLAIEAGDVGEAAVALCAGAFSLGWLGRHEDAVEAARRAADLAIEAGDVGEAAMALRAGAFSLGWLDRHEDAVEAARRAADLAIEAGDVGEAAMALRDGAFSLGQLGRYEDAVEVARRAADLAIEAGDVGEAAIALRHRAFSLGKLDRHEDAVEVARHAADLAIEAGDVGEAAIALRHGAFSLGGLGRREDAVEAARRAADLATEAGDTDEVAVARGLTVANLVILERWEEAFETASAAADLIRKTSDIGYLVDVAWNISAAGAPALDLLAIATELVDRGADGAKRRRLTETSRRHALLQATSLADDTIKLDRLHASLSVLADRFDTEGSRRALLRAWLEAFAYESAVNISDPDRLVTLMAAVELHFPSRSNEKVALLRVAADYHRSGRDPSVLAKLDPDMASTLAAVFPPAEDRPDKRKRKPVTRRKR